MATGASGSAPQDAPGCDRPPALPTWAPAAALVALVLLAYLPALRCGWIWDDDQHVFANPLLRSAAGLRDIWLSPRSLPQWYPVVHTTFWLEHALWGFRPGAFHLVNVLLHGLNAVLLWRLLRRLGLPGAWIAAALFALTPVNVESVAWVTERKNVLSGAFALGSLLLLVRWAGLGADGRPGAGERRLWIAAFVLFLLALLSKSVTATLPAVLLVLAWWKGKSITFRYSVPLLPFLAAGILLGLNTARLEREHVGAEGPDWALSFADRAVLAGTLLWFYAGKLALPADLAFIYPRWHPDGGSLAQWAFPAAALGALAALLLLRGRIGRGPLAAALVYAGVLFPALGFLNVYPFRYSWAADHFQYLAGAALLAPAGVGLRRAAAAASSRFGSAGRAVPALVLLPLGVLTWCQCGMYRDVETLWRETLRRNPEAWIAANNLGALELERGRPAEAEPLLRRAVALNPRNQEGWNNVGKLLTDRGDLAGAEAALRTAIGVMPEFCEAWRNLGFVLEKEGKAEESLAAYRKATSFPRTPPDVHMSLVLVLVERGMRDEALAAARAAVARFPGDPGIAARLGATLLSGKAATEALSILEDAVREHPGFGPARLELGRALFVTGDRERSLSELREAVRLEPASALARYDLGVVLKARGDGRGAEEAWREARRLDPRNADVVTALGRLLADTGRMPEAETLFGEAVGLAPESWELRNGRAFLFHEQGRLKEAAAEYREVVRLNPSLVPARNALAWILATSADPALRSPAEAVALAEKAAAATGRGDAVVLRTLGAAYAAAGRFEDAVKAATEAVLLDPPRDLAEELSAHLRLFRARKAITE